MNRNSVDTNRLLELDLDNDVLDVDTLRQFKSASIVIWLTQNMKEIRKHTAAHLLNLFNTTQPCDTFQPHFYSYCQDDYTLAVQNLLKNPNSRLKRPLPAVASFASRYQNVTCHSLLFRTDAPIVMSQKAEGFIRYMRAVPMNMRSRIAAVLTSGQASIPTLQDVLMDRLQELAAERGELLSSLVWVNDYSMRCKLVVRAFLTGESSNPELDCLKDGHLLTMVYFTCIQYGVTVDRLILQDYSRYAVLADGTALSEEEKRYLSLYLRATTLAQDIAIQDVVIAAASSKKNMAIS